MTRARWGMIVAVALLLGATGLAVALRSPRSGRTPADPSNRRATLLLLTSLPIVFGDDFGLQDSGSPALKALNSRYHVLPISVADGAELNKGDLLLMAQPFAQTPENLVVLDEWVRRGGHLLLLADPLLEWPSKRPLGDMTRPPPMFADTGLLEHWGLSVDAPDHRGVSVRSLAGFRVAVASPGRLRGTCEVGDGGLEARCPIGKGVVVVVADADFLNTASLGSAAEHNLDALLEELARVAGK